MIPDRTFGIRFRGHRDKRGRGSVRHYFTGTSAEQIAAREELASLLEAEMPNGTLRSFIGRLIRSYQNPPLWRGRPYATFAPKACASEIARQCLARHLKLHGGSRVRDQEVRKAILNKSILVSEKHFQLKTGTITKVVPRVTSLNVQRYVANEMARELDDVFRWHRRVFAADKRK